MHTYTVKGADVTEAEEGEGKVVKARKVTFDVSESVVSVKNADMLKAVQDQDVLSFDVQYQATLANVLSGIGYGPGVITKCEYERDDFVELLQKLKLGDMDEESENLTPLKSLPRFVIRQIYKFFGV